MFLGAFSFLFLSLLLFFQPVRAEEITIEAQKERNFGRLIVTFKERNLLPPYRVDTQNGVLVLQFEEKAPLDVARIPVLLRDYIIVARADPEERGARFALARGVSVNTMTAGAQLFIDLLPPGWSGAPPPLPSEVVAALARKAEEAEKNAREAELLRAIGAREPTLDINLLRGPTFTRFVFTWNIPYEVEFQRKGKTITLTFDRTAEVDLAPLRANLPLFIDNVIATPRQQGGLTISIVLAEENNVRAFREEDVYIVDVEGRSDAPALDPLRQALEAALREKDGGSDQARERVDSPGGSGKSASDPHADKKPPATAGVELSDDATARFLADGAVRIEASQIGQTTRLVFPYPYVVGAALFTRGSVLWAVFDDPARIELGPLQGALAGFARAIDVQPIGEKAQAVRIDMAEPLLATLNPDNTFWIITIGNMMVEPTRPLPIRRRIDDNGHPHLDIPFGPVSAVHEIKDPVIGDTIMAVTGKGQPRGLIKPQRFVDLDALSSAHGLAFVPFVDDLRLSVENELVSLSRPSGLSLSIGVAPQRATLLNLPGVSDAGGGARAGALDFTPHIAETPPAFWRMHHELTRAVSAAQNKDERVKTWYDLASFYLANNLATEALGVLNVITAQDTTEVSSQKMAVLRGAAETLLRRPEEALAHFERSEFADSLDIAVWRTIALNDLADYIGAHKAALRGENVIGAFPAPVQKRFLLAALRAAIELNDFGKAQGLLTYLDPESLNEQELRELDLLNARVIDANGRAVEAIDILSSVVRDARGGAAAEATLRLVRLQRREGLITLDQAIERLEQLAVSWRGNQTEIETLRMLGQFCIEKKDFRRAFEVMRTAMMVAPHSSITRLMSEEMQDAFVALFLDGEADAMKPVDALALYYDFRELTPTGRRGDAVVRKLADRLVDIDLLPQAAELLNYQIENRVRGAARAELAADLALIYLLDKHPDRALMVLARTRQGELPVAIERQRRVIEARALAETGKPDLAIDLLKPLKGNDIARLRAEILWQAERYVEAGDQFEQLLGNRWNDDLPLGEGEQLDALKAGIAFTLAGDRLSLDRLRSKFFTKMAETAHGVAFETVTAPVNNDGVTFNEIVRSISAINGIENFLTDYRTRFRPSSNAEMSASETLQEAPAAKIDAGEATETPADHTAPAETAPTETHDAPTDQGTSEEAPHTPETGAQLETRPESHAG